MKRSLACGVATLVLGMVVVMSVLVVVCESSAVSWKEDHDDDSMSVLDETLPAKVRKRIVNAAKNKAKIDKRHKQKDALGNGHLHPYDKGAEAVMTVDGGTSNDDDFTEAEDNTFTDKVVLLQMGDNGKPIAGIDIDGLVTAAVENSMRSANQQAQAGLGKQNSSSVMLKNANSLQKPKWDITHEYMDKRTVEEERLSREKDSEERAKTGRENALKKDRIMREKASRERDVKRLEDSLSLRTEEAQKKASEAQVKLNMQEQSQLDDVELEKEQMVRKLEREREMVDFQAQSQESVQKRAEEFTMKKMSEASEKRAIEQKRATVQQKQQVKIQANIQATRAGVQAVAPQVQI